MKKKCCACEQEFEIDKDTIHCLNCDRWYCCHTSCWLNYDEDPTEWPNHIDKQSPETYWYGPNGEFEVTNCDICDFDNE